jgi:hypothetical protein
VCERERESARERERARESGGVGVAVERVGGQRVVEKERKVTIRGGRLALENNSPVFSSISFYFLPRFQRVGVK